MKQHMMKMMLKNPTENFVAAGPEDDCGTVPAEVTKAPLMMSACRGVSNDLPVKSNVFENGANKGLRGLISLLTFELSVRYVNEGLRKPLQRY